MSNIKVDVRYETPKADKFTALMEQYKVAKELADTTEKELIPLIEVGGKAKYHAIIEQIGILGSQLREFSIVIGEKHKQRIRAGYYNDCGSQNWFVIEYDPNTDTIKCLYGLYQLDSSCGHDFIVDNLESKYTQARLFSKNGFVTLWGNKNYRYDGGGIDLYNLTRDQQDLYERLEADLHRLIQLKIDGKNQKTKELNNTLKHIRGGN